jgi:hypothetical protein
MGDPVDFFVVGYVTLPTIMGFGTESLDIWAAFNFGMLIVLLLVAGCQKGK